MVVYELYSRSVPHNGSTVGVWVSRQTSDVSRQVGHPRWDRWDTQKDNQKRKINQGGTQVGHSATKMMMRILIFAQTVLVITADDADH